MAGDAGGCSLSGVVMGGGVKQDSWRRLVPAHPRRASARSTVPSRQAGTLGSEIQDFRPGPADHEGWLGSVLPGRVC